jgi:serine/threonine protein phosphatase PrpC
MPQKPIQPAHPHATSSSDTILDQIRYYEKEGFIPPHSCCGGKRVSITKITVNSPALSFRIMVLNNTSFDVSIENGATSSTLDGCTMKCESYDRLSAKGKAITNPQTGIISHPAFKPGSTLGGWLPHYAIGVLVYLLLRLLDDDGSEIDIVNSAVGPVGFELGLANGLAMLQGKRGTMEDYRLVYPPQRGIALYGVFDGHGGGTAADFVSKHLPLAFHAAYASPTVPMDHGGRALAIRRSLKSSIEDVDRRFLTETKETSGSTVCFVAIDLDTLAIHVANVGDTRCTLCREGRAVDLSIDHKANHPAEIARVMDAGGFVARGRALGLLAISRALGDRDLKRTGADASPITAVPDIDTFVLDPSRDEFIVLACDGLFDVMTSQQVVAFVRARFAEGCTEDATANALASHAINVLGSLDNVTVIVVVLSWVFVGGNTGIGSANSTPRSMRAPTIRRTESATLRAAKASAHKRQTSRMSSTESSSTSIGGLTLINGT